METIPKPAMGKKLKARAPLPPTQATVHKPSMEQRSFSESYVSGNQSVEDVKENMLPRKMDLSIYLPDGQEKAITVDGSKAVMDLLVDLCSQYHLNPAQHVLEVKFGASQQPLTLRPNTLIGTLDVDTVYLKEKVTEVKPRKPPPRIPEKTVRLIVNFLGTQKAVVRVNPEVPLQSILPSICEKCEFNHENVILLSDSISKEELDMAKSLKDLGIKELYVWNSKQEKNRSLSTSSDNTEKEKKGILGFFRSYKKSSKNEGNVGVVDKEDYEEVFKIASTSGNNSEGFSTAPSSPSVNSRPIAFGASLSLSNISGIGAKPEMKKRRAPPPPKPAPQEVVFEKNMEQKIPEQLSSTIQNEEQKKKRRAPPPPTSQVPNAVNEEEENRKSTTGNERQVPQKPPRGTTRSPPQLEIPPPPPYPPPEYNIMDSPVYENGAVITGPTTFVPVPAKQRQSSGAEAIHGDVPKEELLVMLASILEANVFLSEAVFDPARYAAGTCPEQLPSETIQAWSHTSEDSTSTSPTPECNKQYCLEENPGPELGDCNIVPFGEDEVWGPTHEVSLIQTAHVDNRGHHFQTVLVNDQPAKGMRDTGATLTMVQPHRVPFTQQTGRTVTIRVAGGAVHQIPLARITLDRGAGKGNCEVGVMSGIPVEVLLGNDLGYLASAFACSLPSSPNDGCMAVTRSQARQEHTEGTQVRTLALNQNDKSQITWAPPDDFRKEFMDDPTLTVYRTRAETDPLDAPQDRIVWEDGLLYRVTEGRHLGIGRSLHRLTQAFFWPGLSRDVRQFCCTCDTCQRVGKWGDHPQAALHPLPVIGEPFHRIAVDIVGPLAKASRTGKKYILTVVDYATWYPEAVALSSISSEVVADALVKNFTRVGFPREIVTDHGTQFTSDLIQQIWQTCRVRPIRSFPYHPQHNSLCERFNGTLEQMLRTFVTTHNDWERFLPHLLFAYREVPQESTGFSPFELLYGRKVRGPLDLLREYWEGKCVEEETPIIPYVLELRERLESLMGLVRENLRSVRPNRNCGMIEGPRIVNSRASRRTYHVIMMKEYFEWEEAVTVICAGESEGCVLPDLLEVTRGNSSLDQVQIGAQLGKREREQAQQLLREQGDMFSTIPGFTLLAQHRVETLGHQPLRQPTYRVLDRIQAAGMTIRPNKCQVGMAEVQYLGHRVGCGMQRPEPAKIEAILNWLIPRTKKQVLAFLGTAGYYRKFVPSYSDIAKPLTDLTKKSLPRQVLWSPEYDKSFRNVKEVLGKAPILAATDFSKRFMVHTDASMFGLGAVLSQVNESGEEHPIPYLSRKQQDREMGYTAIEKECLPLVWALKKLQPYLYGREFTWATPPKVDAYIANLSPSSASPAVDTSALTDLTDRELDDILQAAFIAIGEKSLIRCNSVSSEEVLTAESIEAEEAESLNSFTGDSGMASSPSDIVSLGLHNDNTKSKENTLNQDNAKEKVENCKPKLHLERSDSYNVDESSSPQRKRDDDVASVRNGDEDIFIAAQLDKTLEEFNEDSEGIDDADDAYSHHIHSSSTPVEEEISSYKYDAGTDVRVPVTIIDEVPDMNIYSVKTTEDKTSSKKEYSIQKTSAQTQTEDKTNNNTNVSDGVSEKNGTGKTFNFASNTPRGKSYTNNTKTDMLTSPTSARNEFNTNVNTTDKYENDSRESKSPISSSAKAKIELRSVKEKTESFIENKQAIEKVKNEKEPISTQKNISIKATEPTKPTVWRQQPYEPKVGMTTFTVVPPKPDVKKYDRGASLSASAIKIDDFGNLISPHSSQDKKYIYESLSNETEGPLVERAKEFWRSNSIDAQAGDSKEQPVKKFSSMKSNSSKPNLQDPENNPLRNYLSSKGAPQTFMKTEDFKGHPVKNVLISSNKPNCQEQKNRENHSSPNDLTPQIPINKFPVRDSGLQQTKQIQATTAVPQEKMIIIEHTSTNKGRTDLPFLKPQKRTSSQYVASAISKYTEPSNNKISETKSDQSFPEINSVKDRNILVEEKKVGNGNADKRETTIEPKTMFIGSNIQGRDRISKMDTVNKFSFVNEQPPINAKCSTSEYQNVNGSQSINGNKSISIFEKKNEKTNSVYSPLEPQVRLSTGPSNAFLKAVREKSGKIEQANSFGFHKEQTRSVNITEKESKPDIIPSTIIDEPDNLVNSDIFGPKAKFRPVVQKPAQQDTSLHSALMGAIQSGEGKEKLRKIQSSPTNGVEKKFPEPENERSALLSAIRAHNGTSTLKKVSSAASNELQAIRNIDSSIKNEEKKQTTHQSIPPPPFMPPPPPPTMLTSAPKVSPTIINNSVNAREALMEAIRSGTGASRLKKV
ncbi:protein cordon-bleu [Rhinophrynus dorsalis]